MTKLAQCPSSEQWKYLLDDSLPASEQVALHTHLEQCGCCRDLVTELATNADSETGLASRLADRQARPAPDAELVRVMSAVKAQVIFPTTHGESSFPAEVVLDFLSPPVNADHLGRLGPYEIIEIIGRGGMGLVLKGFDSRLNRFVAVKVLAPQLAASATARARFRREGQAAAAVTHDHVIAIHAVDEANGLPYLVMEYVAGRSLDQRIESTGPLQLKEILRIGMQAAQGLAAAHAQGLVHRDIKPANILLENGVERVKITDFGLARAVDDVRITKPGVLTGTPEYMSPEQARGESVDHRSDLFSLGCVLYAMCTGLPPFRAENTVAQVRRICEDTPRPIAEVNPDIPDWLADIIDRLLAKSPDDRFHSASEVGELLAAHLAHLQQPSAHPQPPRLDTRPGAVLRENRISNRSRPWAISAAIVLLLAAGLAVAESTGVAQVAATVIRIVGGDGTLVIEVDDPSIQVLLDGDEIAITGAGPKELRLRPGKHELQTLKDGQPSETKLVTISRDGREVVKVSREVVTDKTASKSDQPTVPVARQIWANAPSDAGGFMPDGRYLGGLSFDGRYIAIVRFPNVAIRETATGRIHTLTKDGDSNNAYAMYPRFTADGTHVLYSWQLRGRQSELRMVPISGGEPRVIYKNKRDAYPYGSTPDGKHILAGLEGETELQLVAITVADGSLRHIKKLDRAGTRLSPLKFSPVGRFVAYSRAAESNSPHRNVFLLDMDSGDETRITEHASDEDVFGWSPDGRRLIFSMERSGRRDAWSISLNAGKAHGEPTLVKADVGNIAPLLITRDGSLYYTLHPHGPRLFTAALDQQKATATVQPLESERFNTLDRLYMGSWSPDSKELAYRVLGSNRVEEIRIVEPQSGKMRILHPAVSMLHRFFWSPDGTSFVSACLKEPDRVGVYRIDAKTGEVSTLVESTAGLRDIVANRARWSFDGKGVFYGKYLTGIAFRDLQAGTDREVLATDNSHFDSKFVEGLQYSVSLDGRYLALCGKDSQSPQHVVKLLDISSGGIKDLHKLGTDAGSAAVEWMPDGNLLLTVRFGPQRGIWRLSPAGENPHQIELVGLKPWSMAYVAVSPDGKQLAFNAALTNEHGVQVWALENFLPPLHDPQPAATAAAIPASSSAGNSDSAQTKQNQSGPIVRRVWDKAPKTSLLGGISPDGKHLAFGQEKPFGPQLYIRELETGKTQLIGEISGVYSPMGIFSPDKKQMSYRWRNEQRIGEFDDQPSRTLIAADEKQVMAASLPQWSHDGKQIIEALYYPSRRAVDITLISIPDRTTRVLKSIDHHPDRAPTSAMPQTGNHVAYSLAPNSQTSNRDIFLVSTNGNGQISQLIEHPADDFVIAWTPDDKNLLFGSDRSGSVGLWSVRVEDGKAQANPELLKSQIGPLTPLGMTSTGTLFYALAARQNDVFIATIDPQTGKLVSSPSVGVPRNEGSNSTPAWSPDGRYLVCRSNLSGTNLPDAAAVFCIREMQTGTIRVLEPKLRSLSRWAPRWAPDGISLLATGTDLQERRGLFRIAVNTGDATLIEHSGPENGGQIVAPVWSPDGQSVYFVRDAVGKTGSKLPRHIVRRDLATGQEKELRQVPGYVFWMPISPFGNELAFNAGGTLQTLPVTGGEPRVLTEADPGCGICWTPDGRYLFFGRKSADGQIEICRIASTGGEPESSGLTLASSLGIAWFPEIHMHPDGKQIAFANRNDDASEVWALEHFLHLLNDPDASFTAASATGK